MSGIVSLKDKFYGCIAGTHVGAAMGAPVQGWSHREIEETYGTLDRLLAYERNHNGWLREPGTTEEGVERQKLLITAIVEKQDRVNAEDLRSIWVRDLKQDWANKLAEPFDATLLALARSGIPARDIGRYSDYAGLNTFAGYCHPIGLINAGDVKSAIHDAFELAQLYQISKSYAVRWSGVTAAAIASATKPGATIDNVIADIYRYCDYSDLVHKIDGSKYSYLRDNVIDELDAGLKRTAQCQDYRELAQAFDKVYHGCGVPYGMSYANEALTKAICIVRMVKGNVHEAILAAVNLGRDADCVAALAGGIAGALTGSASLPEHYIQQVDRATGLNEVSSSQKTIREQADGLYQAFRVRLQKVNSFVEEMLA
ncbi:ADP-ribosylglycohydrolase family protein [Paenibacillus aestuarii]|uniref:ADP-ribosylglycohydrolase family protein n=1 Tax=Paenibacillus aestuarii TaxID=516965 RepID=A0ABW0KFW7_9BACL|nr:ADP-ribosylglycohydrolase family protein [Paenibacillus aestuarii]